MIGDVDKAFEAIKVVEDVSWDIDDVARALDCIGLDRLAARMNHCAKRLNYACKMLRDDQANTAKERMKDAQQSTRTMMKALMVGMDLGKKEKEKEKKDAVEAES